MRVGSLFSGIGGMDLGLERAGMAITWQVENDPWCQKILEKHWPDVRRWDDVRTFPPIADPNSRRDGTEETLCAGRYAPWNVDLVCGGFPCQPVSIAGRRQAQRDPRWLWPHFARIVRVLRPRYILVENVPGLLVRGHGMLGILADLAEMGFDAEWATLPASAFGATHKRERVFIIACAAEVRRSGLPERTQEAYAFPGSNGETVTDPAKFSKRKRTKKANTITDSRETLRVFGGDSFRELPLPCWGADQPGVDRASYGIPNQVDRVRGLGNAVVPAVAEFIGRLIMEFDACA